MTLNIWNLSGPWRQRREEIVAWLRLVRPDVVCLQEVVESPDGRNQARRLADAAGLGHEVAFGAGSVINGQSVGNAILSRWPIDHIGTHPLPPSGFPDDIGRIVVHARTAGLDVFCTHLAWRLDDGAVRELQARDLAAWIADVADPAAAVPPILAGDLNADPDSAEVRYLTGLTSLADESVYFHDAWRVAGGGGAGYTWDNRNQFAAADREPDRRIDYILVGWRPHCGVGVSTARVVCDRPLTGTHASDHFGLMAEIHAPAPKSAA